jgi:Tfp pilus assembly protein PilF
MARRILRTLLVGITAILLVGVAVPAYAQLGSLRGKVIDESGKGVPDAEVVLDFVGDFARQLKAVTDKNGEWIRAGMPAGGGTWNITVKKGTLVGNLTGVKVALGEMTRVGDVTIKPPSAGGAAASKAPAGMSADEVAKRNKKQNELKALFDQANAAVDAGQYDDAIAKLTQISTELEKCAACFARMGDVYLKKNDLDNAEKSYLKAIDVDPTQAGAYGALASLYNQQKKLDEAAKMSAKALELMGDSGDASQVFNQGVIFWNQSKVPEAKAMFEKASKLDPKMADAHYWLGMALVNEGKLPDAKAPFQEYLKLAPSGQYAATAKAILDTIK